MLILGIALTKAQDLALGLVEAHEKGLTEAAEEGSEVTHFSGLSVDITGVPPSWIPLAEQYQQSGRLKHSCLVSLLFSSRQRCRVRMLNFSFFIFLLLS